MTKDYTLLQEIIGRFADYDSTTEQPTKAGFATWLYDQTLPGRVSTELPTHEEPAYLNSLPPTSQLGPLLGRLNHFYHLYAQQLLTGLPIGNIREFSVLAAIHFQGNPNKTEVATTNLYELSTVTELTRRLVLAGLVLETADPADRRAKRLKLTPAGETVRAETERRLQQLTSHIFQPLSPADQQQLLLYLSHLNGVHTKQLLSNTMLELSPEPAKI